MGSLAQRPREYGEEARRGADIAMDALTDAIAYARSERGRRASRHLLEGFGGLLTSQPGLLEESQSLAEASVDVLPRCEAIYLSPEVSRLLEAARHSLPGVELRESDLLVPCGFVKLAEPIPAFWGDNPLAAFAWATEPASRSAMAIGYPALGFQTPGFSCAIAFPETGSPADYEFPIARLLVAFWLLARQRLFVVGSTEASRKARRRAKGRVISPVIVMTLRRRTYPEANGARTVEWSHRWLTRGHWRNQWYPSEERHKPIWVAPYVKGPVDKPFVPKRRAIEFTR